MTAQVATLELSHALAVELHGLFRALDLRIQTPELVRDKLEAVGQRLDELLDVQWSLPDAVSEAIDRVAAVLRDFGPEDIQAFFTSSDDVAESPVRSWADLKAQLREAYAGYATALRTERVKVPELRPTNYARSILHAGSAVICLALVVLLTPRQLPWAAGAFAVWAWSMETTRRISPWANEKMMVFFDIIAHEQERFRVNSATWYMTALFLLTLTFSPLLCAVAVAVLGFADPLAGLAGRRWGRVRLVNGRTLEGTAVFVAVGTLAAAGATLLVEHSLTTPMVWGMAVTAAIAGGLAELLSRRVDDNVSIPLATAVASTVAVLLLGGSPWG